MVRLSDVAAANALLMSLGGEDQMARIATASFERAMELQTRIDRALHYASQTPPNSAHARQMARILDGSITVDDEASEVPEKDIPMRPRRAVEPKRSKGPKGKLKPGNGLQGRTKDERLHIREWIAEQGIDIAPNGRIPQAHLDQYDAAMAALRQHRREQRMEETMEGQLI